MDFYQTLDSILEMEIALPKTTSDIDKKNLQNKIDLKNQILKKQRKKLQLDPATNKAKVVPITPNDMKIDQALSKIK